ncbi:MAG: TetR/AcrR family transcriptional regulator [Ancrocorticia sp.]|uniref:TetR/AcrR family transcriptional regulator n=1 Tax=Ancrocorticia sp. TaxID=2593684 RepID=UPI003F902EEC
MSERREQIAEAGIRILATRGMRALTHLTIDRELGLPDGSTSYYARTRRDLIALIVENLAARTGDDLAAQVIPEELTPRRVASIVVTGLDATMRRANDHAARLVLLLECRNDPELRASLATRPEVRESFIALATAMLQRLGIADPEIHAHDLAALVDGMLMQRIVRGASINEEAIISAYLTGITARV